MQAKTTFSLSFTGLRRRYMVLWFIYPFDDQIAPVASFPEKVDFASKGEALEYGHGRACAFIDSMARLTTC
ncbi:hypothetical protein PPMP20_18845 [Paraburkholderia phymatum]|uniref:hypothetical protein n=1 Tax=Paraburkholderia phymatum TaxID=148447 RepID=UPI0012FE5374|nr:hypothetical protein [Paraburkholderia phymatum]